MISGGILVLALVFAGPLPVKPPGDPEAEDRRAQAEARLAAVVPDLERKMQDLRELVGHWDLVSDEPAHPDRKGAGFLDISAIDGTRWQVVIVANGKSYVGEATYRDRVLRYRAATVPGVTGKLRGLLQAGKPSEIRDGELRPSADGNVLAGSTETYARLDPKLSDDWEARGAGQLRIKEHWRNGPPARSAALDLAELIKRPLTAAERERLWTTLALLRRHSLIGPILRQAPELGFVREDQVHQAEEFIEAELGSRGWAGFRIAPGPYDGDGEDLGRRLLAAVRRTAVPPAGPGQASRFEDPRFIDELETLSGARFTAGHRLRSLSDGSASFELRDRIISDAQSHIEIMSWAIFDDAAGWALLQRLAAKAKEGVKVRIIVDGRMAQDDRAKRILAAVNDTSRLDYSGIRIVPWRSDRWYGDQRRSLLLVDGREGIVGSRDGSTGSQAARDVELHFQGPAVVDAERLFARVWNGEIAAHDPRFPPMLSPPVPVPDVDADGGAKVAVVDHVAGRDAYILLATLKAIEGATTTIDLAQEQFVRQPAVSDALRAALARGVRVRLLTNSAPSLGAAQAIASTAILASLPELIGAGAEVYLKTGSELHAKFMVVDGRYASVGSYGLHPGAERYAGEMVVNTLDQAVAAELTSTFEQDVASARRLKTADEIEWPADPLSRTASRLFLNQL